MRFLSLITLFTFSCILLTPNVTYAQIEPGPEGHDFALRVSLVHFLDPYLPGPHVSFEHRIKGNNYLRHELGFITDFGYKSQKNLEEMQGFRIRTGHRKYVSNPGKIVRRRFREFSVDYRSLDLQANGQFQLGMLNVFDQFRSYNIKEQSFTFNYIRGLSLMLGKSSRWQFEFGVGVGLRVNNREFEKLPDGVTYSDPANILIFSGSPWEYSRRDNVTVNLSVPMIGALGYQF